MRTLRILSILAIFFAVTFTFTSCDKNETDDSVTISQAEESSFVDNVYQEVESDVDNVTLGEGGSTLLKDGLLDSDCPVVTVEFPDSTPFPRVITIDFGEGCTVFRNNEEITKKGKIIVEVTDFMMNEGATRTVTFVDFYVNDNLIEGTRTMANNGPDGDGFYSFTIQLQNGKVTTDEGVEISREYTRTRTMIMGYETPRYHWDDEFLVEGNGTGTTSDGLAYTQQITSALHIARNCAWKLSGTETTTVGEDEIVIDFGDDVCDNLATRSINGGEPEEFTMQMRYQRRMGSRGSNH